jgi:hypothetical protein
MLSSSVQHSGVVRKLGRLAVLGTAVGSLMGGVAVLSGATPAGASPTNVYVSSYGSDTNPCSSSSPCLTLAHAYSAVATGGTINLAGGTYKGGLDVTKNVSIVGPSSDGSLDVNTATISGGSPVLELSAAKVTITDVVITNGLGTGGGIWNYDGLTLNSDSITDNTGYGGIFLGTGSKLTMNGGSVSGNDNIEDNFGGGLENFHGTAVLNGVSFTHNSAGYGGAIGNEGSLKTTGSTAIHDNAAYASFGGGGIYECTGDPINLGPGTSNTANTPNDLENDSCL